MGVHDVRIRINRLDPSRNAIIEVPLRLHEVRLECRECGERRIANRDDEVVPECTNCGSFDLVPIDD